ncbi:MAG TPA: signal recognition particle-docking protein FtsY [Actinomycetota bacterium]|nr:signal recognition particle-docking protein FtsY [Actinomycetota bacterium]
MPEGIVPELLIALALLGTIGGALFVSRRGRDDEPPGEPRGGVDLKERPDDAVQTIAPPVEAPPVEEAPPVAAPPVEIVPEEPLPVEAPRPTLRDRLSKSRKFFSDRLADAFGRAPDDETWEDVEAALIQADVGVDTATRITEALKDRARERKVTQPEEVKALLAEELVALFDADRDRGLTMADSGAGGGPTVWLVVGVNGTGKTTTIGKLSRDLSERGRSVSLAAADTFRAAADEQLGVWAERTGAQLVKHQHGADPGAVAFDAFQHARARDVDVLIVDTAGRLHTKTPLMDELGKVRRVIEKEGEVHETLLVIDATAGQNGLVQAREFAQAAGVTGVVLTKLDGTAKGGIALAIEQDLGIPIKLVGVGEGVDDMEPFDPKTFVDALLA